MSFPEFSHALYRNDLGALPLGEFRIPPPGSGSPELPGGLFVPHCFKNIPAAPDGTRASGFTVISRGTSQYLETQAGSGGALRLLLTGHDNLRELKFRAVLTPLDFDDAGPSGGICGLVARYRDEADYVALVLDRDGQMKLLQRIAGAFKLLAAKPVEYCLGQSLTITLALSGGVARGIAAPYTGSVTIEAPLAFDAGHGGDAGFIADVRARFGTLVIETTPEEARRIGGALEQP